MRNIIWVIGVSAVGKDLFIERAVEGKLSQKLNNMLGLSSNIESMERVSSSLFYLCNPSQTKIRKARSEHILQEVDALSRTTVSTILLKYQFVDSLDSTLETISSRYPLCQQQYIYLAPPSRKEAYKRLRSKPWWNTKWDIDEFYDDETALIKKTVSNLASKPITVVSDFGYTYRVLSS